jgi:hypothetical protein
MPDKPTKTAQELRTMIMQEIRQCSDLCDFIADAAVTPALQLASYHPSWNFGWVWGQAARPAAVSLKADEIGRKFQREFDLA